MRKKVFLMFMLLFLLTLFAGCSTQKESLFSVQLKDEKLGFTVSEFPVSCIITHPEVVENLKVTLIDQNNNSVIEETSNIQTLSTLLFKNMSSGTYMSYCGVCDGDDCKSSTIGTILVSLPREYTAENLLDVPPSLILGTPLDRTYFLSEQSLLVSFTCLASDDVGLSAVSLVSDVSGLFSETFIQNPSKSSFLLAKKLVLEPGNYLWTCRATDMRAQTLVAPVRRFTIGPPTPEVLPNATGFDGSTTDFSKLTKLTDVPSVVIENEDFGKISFVDNISSLVGVDLSKGIIITKDSITVNSSLYPQLNVSAKLSFYNVKFDEDIDEANIQKDGLLYSVQDLVYEDGTLTFVVGNFSTYSIKITPQGGYNLEETPKKLELNVSGSLDNFEFVDEIIEPLNDTSLDLDIIEEIIPPKDNVSDFIVSPKKEAKNSDSPFTDVKNNSLMGDDVQGGKSTFNPLIIFSLLALFILIVLAILWFIKRRSNKLILRKY